MKVRIKKAQIRLQWTKEIHSSGNFLLPIWILLFFLPFLLSECNRIEELFQHRTTRDAYITSMERSPVAGKPLWEDWKQIGDSIWMDATPAEAAMEQTLIYFVDAPDAWAWRIKLPAGRKLKIVCSPADTSQQIFMDLFAMKDGVPEPEESTEDSLMEYSSRRDQDLILRIQPEFFIEGMAVLRITDLPEFSFPVQGGRRYDIGSFWGDPRDAGARKHEGVDIFASRNTPALAAGDGRVVRTGEGGLGGKTVWLRSGGLSLYYAHLDSVAVSFGAHVKTGDTVGFVGNTGNARTTPPHLHFGIYRQGAVDPLPFIDFPNVLSKPVNAELEEGQRWGRISGRQANIRYHPSIEGVPLITMHGDEVIRFRGGVEDWYQIRLPDGRNGYIHRSLVKAAAEPLSHSTMNESDTLYYGYRSERFFIPPDSVEQVAGYGYFGEETLVRYENQWVWRKRR